MVHVLDSRQLGRPGIIAATALETNAGVALFDTGPESTFENIAGELRELNMKPEDVRHVFLSHIHLDHAGAAWRFARLGATVYVHPRGAPHLLDPRRLVESATRIFGDQMEKLWGRVEAVPAESLRVLEDGAVVDLGSCRVRALATPGHASHHHVYHWDDSLFGGDVAGVRLGSGPPIPPFVPPELEVEQWLESIDRMRGLDVARMFLPHFGAVPGPVAPHFDALEERVRRWSAWFGEKFRAGRKAEELFGEFAAFEADELVRGGATPEGVDDYEAADPSAMAVTAGLRYWRKRLEVAPGSAVR